MYRVVNHGLVECGDGVMVRIGREHITYIKGDFAVGVTIERLADKAIVIHADSISWRNPTAKGVISLKQRNEVLYTIQDVLSFMKVEFELGGEGKTEKSKFMLPGCMEGWVLLILLSMVSGGVGLFGGYRAQAMYAFIMNFTLFAVRVDNPAWLGGGLGIVFGIGVGAFYILRLIALFNEGYGIGTAIKTGAIAGLICSYLVILPLMLFYSNFNQGLLMIGSVCGLAAGAIFGLVAGVVFAGYYSSK